MSNIGNYGYDTKKSTIISKTASHNDSMSLLTNTGQQNSWIELVLLDGCRLCSPGDSQSGLDSESICCTGRKTLLKGNILIKRRPR